MTATVTATSQSQPASARLGLAPSDPCWACQRATLRRCLGCHLWHCRDCGCGCQFRYWSQHGMAHVIPDARALGTAACGDLPADIRGGQFSAYVMRGTQRCPGCFATSQLSTAGGWGADTATVELAIDPATIVGRRGPRQTKLAKHRFVEAESIVSAVQFRTAGHPTPREVQRGDAAQLLPYVRERLRRLEAGIRSTAADVEASQRLAATARGDARERLQAEAHDALVQLAELVLAQVGEQCAERAYTAASAL